MKRLDLVVAVSPNFGIGKNGTIPWRIKTDMDYFKLITTSTDGKGKMNACIMGKNTYLSIPEKFRPLPNRINFVLSRSTEFKEKMEVEAPGVYVMSDFEKVVELINNDPYLKGYVDTIFAIGGTEVYRKAMEFGCDKMYITEILSPKIECDTFLPAIDENRYRESSRGPKQKEKDYEFQFVEWIKK